MSFYNPSKNPFPFYKLDGTVWTNFKPLWHRNNCANYLHTLNPGLRYFQLQLSKSITSQSQIISISLRKVSDNSLVSASISRTIYSEGENRILVCAVEITMDMSVDQYYISVATDFGYYYSETFCVKSVDKEMTLIEWRSSTVKVGRMIYPLEVKQSINLNAKIILLEPTIEEETEENGFGEETATLQILTQPYFMSCVVPNFLGQAISALKLHDQVIINNRLVGDNQSEFDELTKISNVKVVPEDNGCDSYVEITYTKEKVIKTTCEGEIIALNNPPLADIVWGDTLTTEDRQCDVDTICSQVLSSTEFTTDVDGDTLTLTWERKVGNSEVWNAIGTGQSITVTEIVAETYSYRLKAEDSNGAFGYSNVLKYELYNLVTGSVLNNVLLTEFDCGGMGGQAKTFEINGEANQVVKIEVEVISMYGHGFVYAIYEQNTEDLIYSRATASAGSKFYTNLPLNALGVGEFRVQLCLRPCLNTDITQAAVQLTLFESDDVTLSSQRVSVSNSVSCN